MADIDITLSDYFKEFIASQIASGRYETENEVICAGLQLLEMRDAVRTGLKSGDSIAFDEAALASIKSRGREAL